MKRFKAPFAKMVNQYRPTDKVNTRAIDFLELGSLSWQKYGIIVGFILARHHYLFFKEAQFSDRVCFLQRVDQRANPTI
jgi:hypothetical protein